MSTRYGPGCASSATGPGAAADRRGGRASAGPTTYAPRQPMSAAADASRRPCFRRAGAGRCRARRGLGPRARRWPCATRARCASSARCRRNRRKGRALVGLVLVGGRTRRAGRQRRVARGRGRHGLGARARSWARCRHDRCGGRAPTVPMVVEVALGKLVARRLAGLPEMTIAGAPIAAAPPHRGRAPGAGASLSTSSSPVPTVPGGQLVPTSVPTFPWRRETPGYASKRSTYWNL